MYLKTRKRNSTVMGNERPALSTMSSDGRLKIASNPCLSQGLIASDLGVELALARSANCIDIKALDLLDKVAYQD
jgi:hypothetical protein